MPEGNSLINLGDWAKPVNTLIEKISNAVGVVYEPSRIVRKAKAEAKCQEIMTLSNLNNMEITKRALQRFLYEETKKQENIESIIENAIPLIEENAKSDEIENDWLVNFFENAKLISDEDMQSIWSKILAGETNSPGAFSKRALNLASEFDKQDAIQFTNLCKFGFIVGKSTIVVFDSTQEIYNKFGVNFGTLSHLDNLGLIHHNHVTGYIRKQLPKEFVIYYYETPLKVVLPNEKNNNLEFGQVLLSQTGEELIKICGSTGEKEILEYTIEKWRSKGMIVEELNNALEHECRTL